MALFKVRYKGLSDIREMSTTDLAARGVGVASALRWVKPRGTSVSNPVFIKDPSDDLLRIFEAEGTFTVTEVKDGEDGPVEGTPIVEGAPLDDTGLNVIDGNTGQVSTAPGANPITGAEGQKAKNRNA